jgi:hypothetical protein
LIMSMWAAGTAAAGSVIAVRSGVEAGFFRLTGAVAAVIGLAAVGSGIPAIAGVALLVVGAGLARRTRLAGGLLGAGSLAMLVTALAESSPFLAVTGSVALGGVTGGLLLGHWYLVDPRLPRLLLRRLNFGGACGLLADVLSLVALEGLTEGGVDALAPIGVYGVLAGASIVLMLGVWGALREPAYSAVMAATGLSYLAVLTCLAAVAVGRSLVT